MQLLCHLPTRICFYGRYPCTKKSVNQVNSFVGYISERSVYRPCQKFRILNTPINVVSWLGIGYYIQNSTPHKINHSSAVAKPVKLKAATLQFSIHLHKGELISHAALPALPPTRCKAFQHEHEMHAFLINLPFADL